MTVLAEFSTIQWIIIGGAALAALAGFGLMAVNMLAILRPRHAGEKGAPRPLVGKPPQLTRRAFNRRLLGAGFTLSMSGFGAANLAFLWPSLGAGFGSKIKLAATIDEVKAQIQATKLPFYFAPGRFYLVEYDEANDKTGLYTKAGLVAEGLMALYQRCVHLGCRVPFCQTSQWFECPCHGSKYNHAGEYRAGPAPRGLDRFPLSVTDKILEVNTGIIVTGPPRGTNTTGQNPEGVFCVDPAVSAEPKK